jgi:hypothetical protein
MNWTLDCIQRPHGTEFSLLTFERSLPTLLSSKLIETGVFPMMLTTAIERSMVKTAVNWKIPRELALLVIARDHTCVYCRTEFDFTYADRRRQATWEHIVNDLSLITIENIALCCKSCNSSKNNRTLIDWMQSSFFKRTCQQESLAPVVRKALESASTQ